MSFCHVQWHSQVLEKAVAMNVLLPDCGVGPFPVFYLLHGLSDDFSQWHRRTRIEWYVRDLPLIVVMADGFRGFYTDNEAGPRYAAYMAQELPAFVERQFNARREGRARAIGGLSMGGYGALRLALGFPDRYVSANSHSGAVMHGSRPLNGGILDSQEFVRVLGQNPTGSEHDLLVLAQRAQGGGRCPALRLDCGVDDFLYDDNRDFHARLTAMGVPHDYAEHPGAHTWDYWDKHVQSALTFHARHLGIGGAGGTAG